MALSREAFCLVVFAIVAALIVIPRIQDLWVTSIIGQRRQRDAGLGSEPGLGWGWDHDGQGYSQAQA